MAGPLPAAEIERLLAEHLAQRPQDGLRALVPAEIVPLIESQYYELMAFQHEQTVGHEKTTRELTEEFLKRIGWSALDWHKNQENVVLIHDRMFRYEAQSVLEGWLREAGEKQELHLGDRMKKEGIVPVFREVLAASPAANRFERIMELDAPCRGDVYRRKTDSALG